MAAPSHKEQESGAPARAHFPAIETHLIQSRHVRQTFKIDVMLPMITRGEVTRFPVVYATDGNMSFDMLKGISYLLQASERDAPRFILVGIGYPGNSPMAGAVLRSRDLTFAGCPGLRPSPPNIEGVLLPEAGTRELFGAQDFQRFMAEELIPLIDARYNTVHAEQTLFGHSGGGGFGLYTLLTRPRLFRHYIVSSPGLVYTPHGETIDADACGSWAEYLRQFMSSGTILQGTKLYMSAGTEEEFEPDYAPWRITSNVYRLAAAIKAAALPGVELIVEVFSGETHMTVWPMAFVHGIRAVFGARGSGKDEMR